MKNIFKINFENLEPVVELPVNDFLEEQEDLESVNFIVSNDELISEEVQEYDELASDIELVENLNNTLENQLENNQANDASLEMYHVAMEQVFRKYNIPYKNNVVSTEDYSVTTVSMEKQKGFLSNLKDGIWNIIIKVYNAIKEFFKKIFNMIFRKGKAKAQEIHKDIKQNERVYEIAYKQIASGDKELEKKVENSSSEYSTSADRIRHRLRSAIAAKATKGVITDIQILLGIHPRKMSFSEAKKICNEATDNHPELFEEYEVMAFADSIIEDSKKWNTSYFFTQLGYLTRNPAIKRVKHLIEVREYIEKNGGLFKNSSTGDEPTPSEEQPKSKTKLDVKFGYVKINPIIAPTRVTDGDFNKFRDEFKNTFNGFFHHNGFEHISQDFDDLVEIEKEYNETLKKHSDVVTKNIKLDPSSVSNEIMDSCKKLIDVNDEYLKSGGGFTNSVKNVVERFTANPIPSIKITTTEEGRLHVTEAEDKNKIEMLPVCHPSDIKNYVYKLHDALDQMSKLEKKINSVDFAGLMERRKEHEAIMDELHEKLVKDGHGEISNRAANSFRKHNKVLMVYFSNLGTVLKYNSKYINSLVDYFDEVNRVFKRVSPYVGTTK